MSLMLDDLRLWTNYTPAPSESERRRILPTSCSVRSLPPGDSGFVVRPGNMLCPGNGQMNFARNSTAHLNNRRCSHPLDGM